MEAGDLDHTDIAEGLYHVKSHLFKDLAIDEQT